MSFHLYHWLPNFTSPWLTVKNTINDPSLSTENHSKTTSGWLLKPYVTLNPICFSYVHKTVIKFNLWTGDTVSSRLTFELLTFTVIKEGTSCIMNIHRWGQIPEVAHVSTRHCHSCAAVCLLYSVVGYSSIMLKLSLRYLEARGKAVWCGGDTRKLNAYILYNGPKDVRLILS